MLILLAHGSRDPRWRASIQALAKAVEPSLPGEAVRVAFMQFEGPTLEDVVKQALQAGHETFRLLPLFMATAGHVEKDIMPLVSHLARSYPELQLRLLTPVGEDDLFPSLIVDIASRPHEAR